MNERQAAGEALSKVPAITLGFWVIKILATTLGETGGDTVTMSWLGETTDHPVTGGYAIGTAVFGIALVLLVWAQIRARKFNPWLYWATIVASTTCGTTLADFSDRSLGIGYPGGSLLLLACVLGSLFAWHRTLGHVDVRRIFGPREETFYWVAITFSLGRRIDGSQLAGVVPLGFDGWKGLLAVAAYSPLLLWGPMLAALTVSYWKRRRAETRCPAG